VALARAREPFTPQFEVDLATELKDSE